jgi:hypothetical protein
MNAVSPGLRDRGSTVVIATLVAALLCLCGCVATKYKLAKKGAPPPQLLSVDFPPAPPLQPTLSTVISYRGPGTWKREALWDEYVVTLENRGDQPVTVDSATLADAA